MLLLLLALSSVSSSEGTCDGFQATFNLEDVVGSWRVAGFVPVSAFPPALGVSCYTVTFTQSDIPGLRWLINQNESNSQKYQSLYDTSGIAIRQRYQTHDPLDIWSRSVANVSGCFEQVVSMKTAESKHVAKQFIRQVLSTQMKENREKQASKMQLHLVKTRRGRLLLQLLWGKVIAAVVYVKQEVGRHEEHALDSEQLKSIESELGRIRHRNVTVVECDRLIRNKKLFAKTTK